MHMENKQYQAFIFDLDGTILSTVEDICTAVNVGLGKYHLPLISDEECMGYLGNGSVLTIKRAMHFEHEELFDDVFKTYYDYYHQNFCVKTHPYEGLIEALDYAKSNGILCFVYTNKPEAIAQELIQHCFKKGTFEKTVGVPLGGIIKPDPKAFIEACKEYRLDYSRCAYFGDSVTDLHTAYNLGIPHVYSVLWGYQPKEKLLSCEIQPTAYLDKPLDIIKVVDHLI